MEMLHFFYRVGTAVITQPHVCVHTHTYTHTRVNAILYVSYTLIKAMPKQVHCTASWLPFKWVWYWLIFFNFPLLQKRELQEDNDHPQLQSFHFHRTAGLEPQREPPQQEAGG